LRTGLRRQEERQLVSTYFDTRDAALHKAGVYLRVRDDGSRVVQTVKTAKSNTELIERLEWEREIGSRTPNLGLVGNTPLAPLLTPDLRAGLCPVFETQIRRHVFLIGKDGAEIEVAIDRGEIATRDRMRAISELELELKRGKTAALFKLARLLGETVPLRLEIKTKAERGFELLNGGGPKAEKAAAIDIPPELSSADAFRAIARSCLRQIIANEPAMCSGAPEGLHQLRIGLRRLRAAIALFADMLAGSDQDKMKSELKWITQQLGPARDLDVFAADVLDPLRAARPSDAALAKTHRRFKAERKRAYARAVGGTRSDRFRAAMLDLLEWVETGAWGRGRGQQLRLLRSRSIAEHAKMELAKLRKRIKRKGAGVRDLSVEQRHRLRIRAKRLRYATEFFAATFPGETAAKRRQESLAALKDVQDALGGLNDIATRHALVVDGLHVGTKDGGAVAAQLDASDKEKELLHKAERAFQRFAAAKPFWKV
jgi:inorganic triphosphatase YgiF